MKRFYIRLSLAFLVLTLSLSVITAWQSLNSASRLVDETEQKLNAGLAEMLAVDFQPFLTDSIDTIAIKEKIEYFVGINPRIDIYLLGSTGMIKELFVSSGKEPVRGILETESMDIMLRGGPLPIWGPDPLSETGTKPFVVAPLEIMGETGCYLYIVLGSDQYDSIAAMLENSYIVQTLVKSLGLVFLLTVVAGLFLFAVLTRRIGYVGSTVRSFSQGDYSKRIDLKGSDELAELASTIDTMANTIEENITRLEETDKLRRDLIANISHDLRSPLASIRGYLETIVMKFDDLSKAELREYVKTGLDNTEKLNRLVSELLELSKLDANQVELHPEQFSLTDLVLDIVQQYAPTAVAADIKLSADCPERASLAYGDIGLVERAISNLIDNAIKYTPAGGTVTVVPRWNDAFVELRVSDTGRGIDQEDLPHIFDRFYRVEKSRGLDGGGAGLGLAITKKIVELHDSTLSVHSKLNAGTTFSFLLPSSERGAIQA
jgi:signal transduction histidine kinase